MIAMFRTNALSLFARPIDGCEVRSRPLSDHCITHHIASDEWCSVHGFSARDGGELMLGDDPTVPVGLAWLQELTPVLDEHFDGAQPPRILEAWTTYGHAHWALVEWSYQGENPRFLVFVGRRRQFNAHNCGWDMPIPESLEDFQWCALWTTDPESALDSRGEFCGFDAEGRVHELPRPPGWRAPLAAA